jgi:hypothetical protein
MESAAVTPVPLRVSKHLDVQLLDLLVCELAECRGYLAAGEPQIADEQLEHLVARLRLTRLLIGD